MSLPGISACSPSSGGTNSSGGPSQPMSLAPGTLMGSAELRRWASMPSVERKEAMQLDPEIKRRFETSVKWYRDQARAKANASLPSPIPKSASTAVPSCPLDGIQSASPSAQISHPSTIPFSTTISPAPSKPAKRPRSSILPTPKPRPQTTRTAARQVYDIVELRSRLLSQLSRRELAEFMLVEKKGIACVVRELYKTVPFKVVEEIDETKTTGSLYLSAVSHIDATNLTLSETKLRRLKIRAAGGMHYVDEWLRSYQPEFIKAVVPYLQAICPGLRSIRFGSTEDECDEGHRAWLVHLAPIPPPGSSGLDVPAAPSPSGKYHIDNIRTYRIRGSKRPMEAASIPPVPSSDYTIRTRFNLRLKEIDHTLFDQWLYQLDQRSCYRNLYKRVDFGNLPITLKIITKLIKRQISTGRSERLSVIVAKEIAPWRMSTFVRFSEIASSLTVLQLADRYTDTGSSISPADLGVLIETVSLRLPHLKSLGIAMSDVADAEGICASLLSPGLLERRGTVDSLDVHTAPHPRPLFNVLRALSRICSNDARVNLGIASTSSARSDSASPESQCLSHIRKQPRSRRHHLSTVQFPMFDVTSYQQVTLLSFHSDGRPRTLGESHAKLWADEAQANDLSLKTSILPHLRFASLRLAEETQIFQRAVAAGQPNLLEAVDKLLLAAEEGDGMGRLVQGWLHEREVAKGEIMRYMWYLKAELNGVEQDQLKKYARFWSRLSA